MDGTGKFTGYPERCGIPGQQIPCFDIVLVEQQKHILDPAWSADLDDHLNSAERTPLRHMARQNCNSCGELLPPVNDAFCSYCHAEIGKPVSTDEQTTATGSNELSNADPGRTDKGPVSHKPWPTVYKVPRRFDLSMIFVVTFAYSAAFGLMQALNFYWQFQVALMLLFTIVGLIQMFAPEQTVRMASILTGVACMAVSFFTMAFIDGDLGPAELMTGMFCGVFGFGSLLGYCAGVLTGSLFMLIDYVRRFFG